MCSNAFAIIMGLGICESKERKGFGDLDIAILKKESNDNVD